MGTLQTSSDSELSPMAEHSSCKKEGGDLSTIIMIYRITRIFCG